MTPAGYGAFSLTAMQHSVTLADTKAGFLLAGSVAFFIFMAKEALLPGIAPPIAAIVAMGGFLITAGLAAATFRPRFGPPPAGSLAYWRSAVFTDETSAINAASDPGLAAEADRLVGAHLYGLARVCRSKYLTLNLAFWAAVVAVGAFLIWRLDATQTTVAPPASEPVEVITDVRHGANCAAVQSRVTAPGVRAAVTTGGSC